MSDSQKEINQIDLSRRGLLFGVTAVGGLGFAGTAIGKPGGGPPGTRACDIVVPDDYSTIQAAVDAAASEETVCVRDGTYVEQVVISKSLTLKAVGGASPTIQAPTSPDTFTIPESLTHSVPPELRTWEPVVFAYGGQESGGDVTGTDTVAVTISGFTIDGDDRQPSANRSVGILARNVNGDIRGNEVENMGVGGKESFGVLVYGDSEVTIASNDVSEYERTGIGANGDSGTHPAPTIDVIDNTVVGAGGVGEAWGPNGIQIGFGAGGTIRENTVANNRYGDDYSSATSSGIIVFASSEVMVHRNSVSNSDIALASAFAENNRLVQNHVNDAIIGAYLAVADNNKLVNNEIEDNDSDLGTYGILNTGENNKLIGNTIEGFDTMDIYDLGVESKVHANRP